MNKYKKYSFYRSLIKRKEKAQAIFELIVFLPFLIFFFTILLRVGDSINSSINQQKATRGYFMNSVRNSSLVPALSNLEVWRTDGHQIAGLYSFGFRERSADGGNKSFAPCYKMAGIIGSSNTDETCDEVEKDEAISDFIRVYTFYGVCGATYFLGENFYSTYHFTPGLEGAMNNNNICTFGSGGAAN